LLVHEPRQPSKLRGAHFFSRAIVMRSTFFFAIALLSSTAAAHDHWLVPSVAAPDAPMQIDLRMEVGERLVPEEEKPFERRRIGQAMVLHGSEVRDVESADGAKPFLRVNVERGENLVAVERLPATIELPAREFEDYLREEGLDAIIAERARRGESDRVGREKYGRSIKLLVRVGAVADGTYARELGEPIEILPREDPSLLAPGATLHVVVKFRGAPLAGVRVDALRAADGKTHAVSARTNASGVAALPIDADASWLVRLVHMERCTTCESSDWQSYWASYAFSNDAPPRPNRGKRIAAIVVVLVLALAGVVVARELRQV